MGRKFTDNALTTLAGSITSGSGTLTVATTKGDNFPAVTGRGTPGATPDYFVITMEDASGNREKMRVENRTAGSDVLGSGGFPLVRAYDGTSARAWSAGDQVDLRFEKSEAQDVEDKVQSARRDFGVKGSTTSALNLGYYGGNLIVDGVLTAIADGTVALTASQTNYVERTPAGVVSANIVGFSADKLPLAQVTTDSGGITQILDRRSDNLPGFGRISKSVAGGADVTLTTAEALAQFIEFTGAISASIAVIFPNVKRSWTVRNNTSGAFNLTAKIAGQTGAGVPQGSTHSMSIFGDGTDIHPMFFQPPSFVSDL